MSDSNQSNPFQHLQENQPLALQDVGLARLGAGSGVLALLGYHGWQPDEVGRPGWLNNLYDSAVNVWSAALAGDLVSISVMGGSLTVLFTLVVKFFRGRVTSRTLSKPPFEDADEQTLDAHVFERLGYSDRLSYVMAELSAMAYMRLSSQKAQLLTMLSFVSHSQYIAEGTKTRIAEVERILNEAESISEISEDWDKSEVNTFLEPVEMAFQCAIQGAPAKGKNRAVPAMSTQGFICYCKAHRFIVVAFRGSEMKVEDWLTNGQFEPKPLQEAGALPGAERPTVHSGFFDAFNSARQAIIEGIKAASVHFKDDSEAGDNSVPVRVFFTGHSLGGALAAIALREFEKDAQSYSKIGCQLVNGGAYTFGAPKIGNYMYFKGIKPPVYRVVNSADVVPRLPGNLLTITLSWIFKGVRLGINLVTAHGGDDTYRTNPLFKAFNMLENAVDQANSYRHIGDMRYLTDVPDDQKGRVKLLSNPNYFDRIQWFWQSVLQTFGSPVKSHSLQIYRTKLLDIVEQRNAVAHEEQKH